MYKIISPCSLLINHMYRSLPDVLVTFLQTLCLVFVSQFPLLCSFQEQHIHTKEVSSMFAIDRTYSVDFLNSFPSHPFLKILMLSCNFHNDILDAISG